jgi:DNA-binding response OmpR family regulator
MIVIIDDDPAIVNMLERILKRAGYETIGCQGEQDAYAVLAHITPDLILLDMRMEQHDSGLNILTWIRQYAMLQAVPVILCSGDIRVSRKMHSLDDYCTLLEKPFNMGNFLDTIASKLRCTTVVEATAM